MAEPYQRVCPPSAPSARSPSLPVAPSWVSTPLPSAPRSDGWLACSSPSPAPRLVLVVPSPIVRALPSAPLPDVLCYDPAYESAELVLACGACYDGIDIVVPAGQFISRASQADADAQAQAWGEEQLSCLPADPAGFIPSWGDLTGDVAIAQVDVYGLKGFKDYAVADLESAGRMWCTFEPALDFCDGPEVEAIPLVTEYERYSVRWKARNDDGVFSYARVGEDWSPAPAGLFPARVDGAESVSISFDANARPCFAFQLAGNVELRRFVAGSPVTYSWPGASPRLFFNGLLQPDIALRDVACFYLSAGQVCARVQRDNFATEYTIANPSEPDGAYSLARLGATDRLGSYQLLGAVTTAGTPLLLVSGLYEPWPYLARDAASASVSLRPLTHFRSVVDAGSYSDATAAAVSLLPLTHRAVLLTLPTESDAATAAVSLRPLTYFRTLVTLATESDAATAAVSLRPLTHKFTLIQAGTYSDSATAAVSLRPLTHTKVS